MPDFDEDDVKWIDGWKVVRSDEDCSWCGSNIRYHPDSIRPKNLIQCFQCGLTLGRRWRDADLGEFDENSGGE